jgi:uncharacterized protein involved in response to NO
MIGGFLFTYAVGFLMTAVPQFLGAGGAGRGEFAIAIALSAAMGLSALFSFGSVVRPTVGALTLVFLAVFFVRRFQSRKYEPPPQFLFIPLGILSGVAGGTISALCDLGMLGPDAYAAGRLFLFEGTMLSFTLGVGGRLVTALLGWSPLPLVQIENFRKKPASPVVRIAKLPVFWQALGFLLGLLLEAFGFPLVGRGLRAVVASTIAFGVWKLHRPPAEKTTLSWGLWISSWFLVLGVWIQVLVPSSGVHGLHLLFVGGFGLMTILIGTRVTIAHGDYDFGLQENSWPLRLTIALLAMAAVTRASAHVSGSYIPHLAYAALCWMAGIGVWLCFFLSKMIWHSSKGRQ